MSAMTSMAGTPLAVKPRAAGSSASRVRAMRCNASATSDAEAAAKSSAFPFVKIVGQDELKLALTLNVIVRRRIIFPSTGPASRENHSHSRARARGFSLRM